MKLNKLEFLSMNNPIRALVQRYVELPRLRRFSKLEEEAKVLEIGCGNGYGTFLIGKYFSPKTIDAIDLDEKMIRIAKKKYENSSRVFQVASATELPFEDNTFDAVFDFGVIHHIPNWKDALAEIHRVLKPGGQIIAEDLSMDTFETWFGKILKRLLDHPYESMYSRDEFMRQIRKQGFSVEKRATYRAFIHYFVCIAKKSSHMGRLN